MLSLGPYRYRNVLAAHGGPVAEIETGTLPVRGRRVILANARLVPSLTPQRKTGLFSNADGSGTHANAGVARHKAISEALERWAFHAVSRSARAEEFGFDIDPSTCGMSAFPGWTRRQARRKAVLEAVERFCLMSWWEGHVDGQVIDTDWPGVSAVAIDSPLGGVTVVVFAKTEWGGYAYGHAAEESFSAACEHAIVEMARHEWVLRSWWLSRVAGQTPVPASIFERRCLYFAGDEGHERFQQRLARRAGGVASTPEVICDRDIPGPWDDYATVWRFALRPPSDGYLRGGDGYFFL